MASIPAPCLFSDIAYAYFNLVGIKKPNAAQKKMLARMEALMVRYIEGIRNASISYDEPV